MTQPGNKLCPYCAEEILATAIKCKHCGEFLTEKTSDLPSTPEPHQFSQPTPQPQVIVKNGEGCFLRTLNIGCVVFLVGFAFFVLIIFLIASN